MRTLTSTANLPIGATVLTRALRDPKVVNIARSMNLDLQDPATLNDLLNRTRKFIESSTQVTLSGNPVFDMAIVPVQDRYVRNAIRTYQAIEKMGSE